MITLHTGKLGVGKSYSATRDVWKQINAGKDCYVNWKINFTDFFLHRQKSFLGKLVKLWSKFTFGNERIGKVYYWKDLNDLYGIRNGELYFDEAHSRLNSRKWESIPEEFVRKITQSRKYGLNMHFITQHQGQVDVIVRRIANDIVVHKKFGKLMMWKGYDGENIEILSNPNMPQPKSQGFGFFLFSKRFAQSYDTFALFEEFEPYRNEPMWDADKVLRQKPESESARSFFDHVKKP
jgi:hypothetical protein